MWSWLALPLTNFSGGVGGVLDHGCDLGRELLGPDLPLAVTSKQPPSQTHLRERCMADASSAHGFKIVSSCIMAYSFC